MKRLLLGTRSTWADIVSASAKSASFGTDGNARSTTMAFPRSPERSIDTEYLDVERRAAHALTALVAYCRAHDWSGHDPYDALNSRLFERLPVLDARLPRLVLTQVLKRSPINVRRLLLVPETQNPKAIGLFLSAFLRVPRTVVHDAEALCDAMVERAVALRSPGSQYWCWGYSFPWQTRTIIVPRGAANLVCTTFVAEALLDAYEQRRESGCLEMAVSAARYLMQELYWTSGDTVASFSYPDPSVRVPVHNANFLGAALLARVFRITGDDAFRTAALRVTRFSASAQTSDGAWPYGTGGHQHWIDNFHTGYNLCGLRKIGLALGTDEFEPTVARGFAFYRRSFIREDGAARYFHNRTYPIDIHSVAQTIVTLVVLRDQDVESMRLGRQVLSWALSHMWDEGGYFYYRKLPYASIRTSYMRWTQAWMVFALATWLAVPEPRT